MDLKQNNFTIETKPRFQQQLIQQYICSIFNR